MKPELFEKLSKIPGMPFLLEKLNIEDDDLKEMGEDGKPLPPPGPSDGSEELSATNIMEVGKTKGFAALERLIIKIQSLPGKLKFGKFKLGKPGIKMDAATLSRAKKRASMAVVAFVVCFLAIFGFMKRDMYAMGNLERTLTKIEIAPLLNPPNQEKFDQFMLNSSTISQDCSTRFTEKGSVPQWLMQVGLDNVAKQDWEGAIRVFTGGVVEAKKTGNKAQQGCFQSFLGAVYERAGDRKKAIEAYMEAYRAAAVPWSTDVEIDLQLRLSRMQAQKEVQKGLRRSLHYQIPADYMKLGREVMQEDPDRAEAYLRFAQAYIKENGEAKPGESAAVLMGLANLYEAREKLVYAELLYWEALHQAQAQNEFLRMGQAADGLAQVIVAQGRKVEGRKMAKQSIRYFKKGDFADTPDYKQAEEWIYSSGAWPSWVPMQEWLPG